MQSIQAEFQRFLSVISRKERPYCPRTMKFFEIDAPFTSFSNVRDHTNAVYSLKIYRSESFLHRRTAHLKSCLPIASAAIKARQNHVLVARFGQNLLPNYSGALARIRNDPAIAGALRPEHAISALRTRNYWRACNARRVRAYPVSPPLSRSEL